MRTEEELAAEKTDETEVKRATPRRKWLVNHFGLNRAARRKYQRTFRVGSPGTAESNTARFMLKNTPENHPVRKVFIDGRAAYVFQPHYQAGIAAYKEEFQKTMDLQDKTAEVPGASKTEFVKTAYTRASRAFVDKIIELTRPKVANQVATAA